MNSKNSKKSNVKSLGKKVLNKRFAHLNKDPYTFEPFESWVWKKYESSEIVDFRKYISDNRKRLFFVGTDSQQKPKIRTCVFSSVLVAWDYDKKMGCGHGATAIRTSDRRPIIPLEALSARLMVEVQRSIEICKVLEEELLNLSIEDNIDYTGNFEAVTIDVNKSDEHKSGRYKDALVGMVMAYGWNVLIKPDNMTASKIADRKC